MGKGEPIVIYGYARVSTDGQTLDSQVAALTAAGAERVFSEKQSGAKTDRAQLAKALAARTHAILDSEPPRRQRGDGMNASYVLGALVVLCALWVAASAVP